MQKQFQSLIQERVWICSIIRKNYKHSKYLRIIHKVSTTMSIWYEDSNHKCKQIISLLKNFNGYLIKSAFFEKRPIVLCKCTVYPRVSWSSIIIILSHYQDSGFILIFQIIRTRRKLRKSQKTRKGIIPII